VDYSPLGADVVLGVVQHLEALAAPQDGAPFKRLVAALQSCEEPGGVWDRQLDG
jgi:hypothetical protein